MSKSVTRSSASSGGHVTRFSVSLPEDVAMGLDQMVAERGLPGRSQALTEIVRRELVAHRAEASRDLLAGTLTLVYRDAPGDVRARITRIQRRHLREVITSQHAFLEDDHSLEVLLVQGPAHVLRTLRDELIACRGVSHVELTLTTTLLPPLHGEGNAHD